MTPYSQSYFSIKDSATRKANSDLAWSIGYMGVGAVIFIVSLAFNY